MSPPVRQMFAVTPPMPGAQVAGLRFPQLQIEK